MTKTVISSKEQQKLIVGDNPMDQKCNLLLLKLSSQNGLQIYKCCENNETQLTISSIVRPHYKHNIPRAMN